MDTKTFRGVEIKDAAKGEVRAVFSTFDVVDHDGDVTLPGAIEDGAPVRISSFNHSSWGDRLPAGKGVIRVKGDEAVLDGRFFLNTQHGRDTFETVKEMDDLQEWSYGFDVMDAEPGERDGQTVRRLKRLKVHEVSPVLLGAGVGTRTLATKARTDAGRVPAVKKAIPEHETAVVSRSWDGSKTVASIPDDARPSELRSVFAWVDPDGDPEAKSSYKFPHHHGVAGPANLRACMAGIAVLNGARGGADIPEADRQGIYDHLAAHLRDGDREPPELRTAPEADTKSQNLRFADEAAMVMAAVSGLADRASDVVAIRARKGKGMSRSSADLLSWVRDETKRLDALLSTPVEEDPEQPTDDEVAAVLLGAVARINDA